MNHEIGVGSILLGMAVTAAELGSTRLDPYQLSRKSHFRGDRQSINQPRL